MLGYARIIVAPAPRPMVPALTQPTMGHRGTLDPTYARVFTTTLVVL